MRNVLDKIVHKIKTHIYVQYFFFSKIMLFEIMWKNKAEADRPQMTKWTTRFVCWIPKAQNTQSEYVILIAFPRQQWLHEHASILLYMHTVCLIVR